MASRGESQLRPIVISFTVCVLPGGATGGAGQIDAADDVGAVPNVAVRRGGDGVEIGGAQQIVPSTGSRALDHGILQGTCELRSRIIFGKPQSADA